MKNLLFLVVLLFSTTAFAQQYMLLPIIKIYDGDTIFSSLSTWRVPVPLDKVSIRIAGIDTPELPAKSYVITGKLGRAQCIKEAELALKAKRFVEQLAKTRTIMKVENFKYGKYGGTIVADVKIGGVSIGPALIEQQLAVPYFGGTKTHDWCK